MPVLVLLYLVIPAMQVWFFLDPATSHVTGDFLPPPQEMANYIVSVLVYHALLANLIIAVRVPWVQRFLPHDRKVRFHIFATLFVAAGLVYHALFKIFDGKMIDAVTWTLLGLFVGFVLLSLLWTPVPGFQRFRNSLMKVGRRIGFLTYGFFKRTHNALTLALVGILFLHVFNANAIFQDNPVSTALWIGYPALAVLLFLWSKVRLLFLPVVRLKSLKIQEDVQVLELEPNRRIRYRPGQFAYLRFRGQKGPESHPFSFLSEPGQEGIAFGIRAVGDFTRAIKHLEIGTPVRVDGGYGAFFPSHSANRLCFVASGIGVVPFLSLLRYMDRWNDHRPVVFFVSVAHRGEIPDLEWLEALARRRPHLNLIILEQDKEKRRFDPGLFGQYMDSPESWGYWVCTSPRIWKGVQKTLRALKVPSSRVHSERFSFGS